MSASATFEAAEVARVAEADDAKRVGDEFRACMCTPIGRRLQDYFDMVFSDTPDGDRRSVHRIDRLDS